MYQRTVLDNGLRVVSSTMPHTRSVSISLFVGAGSRYESDEDAGVSHYLEHMLFKGTERRPTPQEISEAIEGIGGITNAGTDKELTVYWAKVGDQHFDLTFDVLADCLRNSVFDPNEVEKERQVIIEELAMTEDSPGDIASILIDEVLWPGQPLGRDVGGSKDTVNAISRERMMAYWRQQYSPRNVVVAVAGNVTHERVIEAARQHFGDWEPNPTAQWTAATLNANDRRLRVRYKKTEQAHICLATPGLPSNHPDRYALDTFNAVFGEGMSSRLFLEIREHLSLAYDVHSYLNHYLDTGAVVIAAGVDPSRADEAIGAIVRELGKARGGLETRELDKGREFIKGRLQLRMEDTRAVSAWLGGQELLRNEILTVDEVLAQIDAVTLADIHRVTEPLLDPAHYSLALVGPFRKEARFGKLIGA
jgi:predicted Zn-dependent peptidase